VVLGRPSKSRIRTQKELSFSCLPLVELYVVVMLFTCNGAPPAGGGFITYSPETEKIF
jgi:hypothetical protein